MKYQNMKERLAFFPPINSISLSLMSKTVLNEASPSFSKQIPHSEVQLLPT